MNELEAQALNELDKLGFEIDRGEPVWRLPDISGDIFVAVQINDDGTYDIEYRDARAKTDSERATNPVEMLGAVLRFVYREYTGEVRCIKCKSVNLEAEFACTECGYDWGYLP